MRRRPIFLLSLCGMTAASMGCELVSTVDRSKISGSLSRISDDR